MKPMKNKHFETIRGGTQPFWGAKVPKLSLIRRDLTTFGLGGSVGKSKFKWLRFALLDMQLEWSQRSASCYDSNFY